MMDEQEVLSLIDDLRSDLTELINDLERRLESRIEDVEASAHDHE